MVYSKAQTGDIHNQQFAYLIMQERDHVLRLTLNRPEKKNAFNTVMLNEIAFALSYAHHHEHVWAVVIDAKGDVFSAGADLKAFAGETDDDSGSTIPQLERPVVIGDLFEHLYRPCIAKVHAPAYAGAFLLLCGCTHVVASAEAKFALPEARRGIWPMQVMASLLKVMPARLALNLCMTAQPFSAQQAHQWGLVTHLAQPDELNRTTDQLLKGLLDNSPSAIRLGLEAFVELQHKQPIERYGFLHQKLMEVLQTEDAAEGILAFKEKRKPVWKGK